jgi:hypothetical protein
MGPFVCFLALTAAGGFLLQRHARRWARDAFRHALNPREARLSSLSGLAIGLLLLACAGAVLGLIAGLSRYSPLEGKAPPALTVVLETSGEGARLALRGIPPSPRFEPVIGKGWFSISARTIAWRGPLRWIGFADSFRPVAVLTAPAREDLSDAGKIRRTALAPGNLFEAVLDGPVSRLGLWRVGELRTPWRPIRAGSSECLFTEGGAVVLAP